MNLLRSLLSLEWFTFFLLVKYFVSDGRIKFYQSWAPYSTFCISHSDTLMRVSFRNNTRIIYIYPLYIRLYYYCTQREKPITMTLFVCHVSASAKTYPGADKLTPLTMNGLLTSWCCFTLYCITTTYNTVTVEKLKLWKICRLMNTKIFCSLCLCR